MVSTGWQFLSQDISLVGGFHSPLLSWLGAGGILALCLWHIFSLMQGVRRIRRALQRIHSRLSPLASARQQATKEWIVIPALARKQAHAAHTPGARRDLDDVQEVDRVMRAERAVAAEWLSYRKTLAVEQSSWFMEPTVHAGRSAAEFFSFDSICAHHLNVRFYQQLPSFLTGLGLMFTFLAILIGLSKLHANGAQIEGMQGLINGLAGKFVTSIVGLACANMFTLLEKSLWYRLAQHHRRIVSLLDQMFTQKVQDQSIQSRAMVNGTIALSSGARNDSAAQLVEAVHQRLGAAVSALTTVSQSLSSLKPEDLRARNAHVASEIGNEVRNALRPLLGPLQEAIQELRDSLEKQRAHTHVASADVEKMIGQLKLRVDSESLATASATHRSTELRAGWLPRLRRSSAIK